MDTSSIAVVHGLVVDRDAGSIIVNAGTRNIQPLLDNDVASQRLHVIILCIFRNVSSEDIRKDSLPPSRPKGLLSW